MPAASSATSAVVKVGRSAPCVCGWLGPRRCWAGRGPHSVAPGRSLCGPVRSRPRRPPRVPEDPLHVGNAALVDQLDELDRGSRSLGSLAYLRIIADCCPLGGQQYHAACLATPEGPAARPRLTARGLRCRTATAMAAAGHPHDRLRRRPPRDGPRHNNLGTVLVDLGDLAGAPT